MKTWGLAINCLKQEGGVIHVHMNVHEDEIEETPIIKDFDK